MRRDVSFVTSTLMFIACVFFLWMFFVAATLERTADLNWISVAGRDAHVVTLDFAARWRHGMAGNSPIYMPGFFAVAIAGWFWCKQKSLGRTLSEGCAILGMATMCAALVAPYAAPRIISDFVAQEGASVLQISTKGTWVSLAQGVYSLLTWTALIVSSRWCIKLKSPKPLLIPVALNLILAFVRPWTVADFTSQWFREALAGETIAVFSFLLIPMIVTLVTWIELRQAKL
jgi:hypothetical protein